MGTCLVSRHRGHVTGPRNAPFSAVLLDDVDVAQELNPDDPTHTDGLFRLVRRHFGIRAFGVNGITANTDEELVEPHDELADDHEELFAVMSGHAVFIVDGEELDAPAGALVFVRDPALIRSAKATADHTAILAIGARPGVAFTISGWETEMYP
jgi:hypothetical protein